MAKYASTLSLLAIILLYVWVLPIGIADGKKCVHNPNPFQVKHSYQKYSDDAHTRSKRSAEPQPLRIKVFYDNESVNSLPNHHKLLLKGRVIPRALDFFRRTLSPIIPMTDPILIPRDCNDNITSYEELIDHLEKIPCLEYCEEGCSPVTMCGEVEVPHEHLQKCQTGSNYTGCESDGEDGPGVLDADFVLYVSAKDTDDCGGGTVAYASSCAMEQVRDRPIAGHTNICPRTLDDRESYILDTVLHELSHALVFSSFLFSFFRFPDGTPQTPRGKFNYPPINPHGFDVSENTVKKITYTDWMTYNGVVNHTVTAIVTPTVLEEGRIHYGCENFLGAELESNDTGRDPLAIPSHWEQRMFGNEYMFAGSEAIAPKSRISLAVFKDSGWYDVDFSQADDFGYGKMLGCRFAHGSCLEWINQNNTHPFCMEEGDNWCSFDRKGYSPCKYSIKDDPVASVYQYDSNPFLQGNRFPDYCPIPDTEDVTEYTSCPVTEHPLYPYKSRCVLHRYYADGYLFPDCEEYSCSNVTGLSLKIEGQYYQCSYKDQELIINMEFGEKRYICPSCEEMCYDELQNCPGVCNSPCENNGICIGNNTCECDGTGARGSKCEQDINECRERPGICGQGTCTNLPPGGFYTCTCPTGTYPTGTSSNGSLTCTEFCLTLDNPANGVVRAVTGVARPMAVYSCNPGYGLEGEPMLTCLSNGVWNREPPVCKVIVTTTTPNPLPVPVRVMNVRRRECGRLEWDSQDGVTYKLRFYSGPSWGTTSSATRVVIPTETNSYTFTNADVPRGRPLYVIVKARNSNGVHSHDWSVPLRAADNNCP